MTAEGKMGVECVHDMLIVFAICRSMGWKGHGDRGVDGGEEETETGKPSAFEMKAATRRLRQKRIPGTGIDMPPQKCNFGKVGGQRWSTKGLEQLGDLLDALFDIQISKTDAARGSRAVHDGSGS